MGVKERRTKILLSFFLLSDVDFKSVKIDANAQKIFDYSPNLKTQTTLSTLIKEGSIKKYRTGMKNMYLLIPDLSP